MTFGAPAASPRKRHALHLFSGLPAHYDAVGALMSFGQDARWRRALVAGLHLRPGKRVLDVATGTGMVAAELVRQGAGSVVALDQSDAMLGAARRRLAADAELATRITLVSGQAERLPFDDASFDVVSFTYLLRYVDDPAATMAELARVLVPGGRIGMLEFGVPAHPALRALWRLYTRAGLPAIGRAVSRSWYEVGRFLGPSIEALYAEPPELGQIWHAAGLREVRQRRMSFGAGLLMWGVRDGLGPA